MTKNKTPKIGTRSPNRKGRSGVSSNVKTNTPKIGPLNTKGLTQKQTYRLAKKSLRASNAKDLDRNKTIVATVAETGTTAANIANTAEREKTKRAQIAAAQNSSLNAWNQVTNGSAPPAEGTSTPMPGENAGTGNSTWNGI